MCNKDNPYSALKVSWDIKEEKKAKRFELYPPLAIPPCFLSNHHSNVMIPQLNHFNPYNNPKRNVSQTSTLKIIYALHRVCAIIASS